MNGRELIANKQKTAPVLTKQEWDLISHKYKDWTMQNSPNDKPVTMLIINGNPEIVMVKGINI